MRRATPSPPGVLLAAATALVAAASSRLDAQGPCASPAAATTWTAPFDRVVTPGPDAGRLTLRAALDRLATEARVRLSYSRELLPLDRQSCLADTPVPFGAALARLLAGTGVSAVAVTDDQIVLAPAPATPDAPPVPVLQRVVVTGSASATPARRLPFALDVVDGGALGATATAPLGSILNGRVPGVWIWAQPPATLLARYGNLRGASSFGVSAPKVYLDGIELANPLVLTDLPPERIARVEVIRGPQGASLYGADAISGVVNIVTRHDGGDSTSSNGARSLTVRTGLGAATGAFAGRPVLAQDHAISLRTGAGSRTGGLSLSATTLGAYVPGAAARRLVATGDVRRVARAGTITATARLADAATSAPANPLLAPIVADSGAPDQHLRQLTAGVTVTRATGDRWTHTLTAGVDGYQLGGVASDLAPLALPLDSAQRAATGRAGRATLRASSAATLELAPRVRLVVTGVADYGLLGDATRDGDRLTGGPPRTLPGETGPGYSRDVWATTPQPAPADTARSTVWLSTAGLVAQGTLAVDDALFVTAGLRGERNDGFTAASRFAALPTLGVAAVWALGEGAGAGGATLKVRAAYGSGLRPARTPARSAMWRGYDLLSAALGPESQRGLETGLDLLAGGGRSGTPSLTASITRFDQRASGLLQRVAVAPFGGPHRRLDPAAGTWQWRGISNPDYVIENLGEIDNRGWEFESAVQAGPLALGATATVVDSRVRRTALGYDGDLRAGDRMLQVPRRTLGAFAGWRGGGWSATAQVARASDWINYDRLALARLTGTTQPVGPELRQFWLRYPGVTRIDATLGRDVRRGFAIVLTGSNLLDRQQGEPDNLTLLPGRTVTAGVRATF